LNPKRVIDRQVTRSEEKNIDSLSALVNLNSDPHEATALWGESKEKDLDALEQLAKSAHENDFSIIYIAGHMNAEQGWGVATKDGKLSWYDIASKVEKISGSKLVALNVCNSSKMLEVLNPESDLYAHFPGLTPPSVKDTMVVISARGFCPSSSPFGTMIADALGGYATTGKQLSEGEFQSFLDERSADWVLRVVGGKRMAGEGGKPGPLYLPAANAWYNPEVHTFPKGTAMSLPNMPNYLDHFIGAAQSK